MHVQPCQSLVVIKVEPYTADSDCAAVTLRSAQGEISVLGCVIDVGEVPCEGAVTFECQRIDL